jgi:hypothetical protein
MPNEPRAAYSPNGVKQMLEYGARLQSLVDRGELDDNDVAILMVLRMRGILNKSDVGERVRRPSCEKCGRKMPVIGDTQTFRCICSPDLEQSVADRVRLDT